MKTIGMVVAMQKEIVPFLESQKVEVENVDRKDFSVIKFRVGNNNIICVRSGIGEIYASAATQTLIGEYKADLVINFGVCGSLSREIKTGEVVLVKGVVHYDFDLTPIANVRLGQYPGYSSEVISTDEELRKKVKEIMPGVKEVICASADKFVADEKIKERLLRSFGAEICEMESAGVALTCYNAGVPVLIVKAVSDGEGGAEEYKKTVDTSAKAYIGLINKLSEKL